MKDLKREIELNRIIGEMAGTLRGLSFLYGEEMTVGQMKHMEALLERYDDFFKDEK